MEAYVLTRLVLDNTYGTTIDDVTHVSSIETKLFSDKDEAYDELANQMHSDIYDYLNYEYDEDTNTYDVEGESLTDDELVNIVDDGYHSLDISNDSYEVSYWDDCGEGSIVKVTLEKKEF